MKKIILSVWHFVAIVSILVVGFIVGLNFGGIVGAVLGAIFAPIIVLLFIDEPKNENPRRHTL